MLNFGKAWTEEEIRQIVRQEIDNEIGQWAREAWQDTTGPVEEHPYAWMGHLAIDSLAALRAYLGVALSEVPAAVRDILKKS